MKNLIKETVRSILLEQGREKSVRRYGKVLGDDLAIVYFFRLSTSDNEPGPFLVWGSKVFDLDKIDSTRGNLSNLLPRAYLTPSVKGKDWEPLIKQLDVKGYFKKFAYSELKKLFFSNPKPKQ